MKTGERVHMEAETSNRFLEALPQSSRDALWPMLERVSLQRGELINDVGALITHHYFLERGLVSILKTMRDGRSLEIAAIGIEGVVDLSVLYANRSILESVVQIPGIALRIARDEFRKMLDTDAFLRRLCRRYQVMQMNQAAQIAACNALHSLEQRICRSLLMRQDASLSNAFPLTHELLAMMLGVRRAGVSIAAKSLQDDGLIEYAYGLVSIQDRAEVEERACECYEAIRSDIDTLFLSGTEPT